MAWQTHRAPGRTGHTGYAVKLRDRARSENSVVLARRYALAARDAKHCYFYRLRRAHLCALWISWCFMCFTRR